ncbi:MAG: hypothetical protein C0464_03185 [Cyanobacteria bacterium DS2.008]|nr:hypothetical protein [Cyanobacteria bacterium DS2.008]
MTSSNFSKSNSLPDSDEQIADDVLPPSVEQIAVPIELNSVFPWHRPRKQFVRREQWVKLSSRLIDRVLGTPTLPTQLDGRHEVKYLTLPGLDYLDVEMVAHNVKTRNCILTSIGFLENSVGNAASARAELRQESLVRSGTISDRSHTFNRRIQEITKKSSPAYRELKNKGPFHVINLDACGSMALPGTPNENQMINVIHTLLEYQFGTCKGRWLLFVTTDVRQEQFSEETIARLHQSVKSNALQSNDFLQAALQFFGIPDVEIEDAIQQYVNGGSDHFMMSFALGFGKWLLALAREKDWDMKMHSSYCYSTTPEGDDRASMPCMAFEFIPPEVQLIDPFGVVPIAVPNTPKYAERSLRVLEKVATIDNLDDRLKADDALRQELLIETKFHLERIGYSDEALQSLG